MKQVATLIVAVAVLAVPQAAAKEPVAPKTVFGIVWQDRQTSLVELDALTLRPVSKAAKLGTAAWYLGRSVGTGLRAAFTVGENATAIRFVNLASMKPERRVVLPCSIVGPILWDTADRLVTTCGGVMARVVVVDPVRQRLVSFKQLKGNLLGVRAGNGVLVGVLAPSDTIGAARLLRVDATGYARTVALPGVRAGMEVVAQDSPSIRIQTPAVAINPAGRKVAVVPASGAITVVDLATLSVDSHAVRALSSVRKQIAGAERHAVWTWANTIAVSGTDWVDDGTPHHATPAGLTVVDTNAWTSRLVDRDTVSVASTGMGGRLLSSTSIWDAAKQKTVGNGLSVYEVDGTQRYHLFDGEAVSVEAVAGSYAYLADTTFTHFRIVNTMSGKAIGNVRTAKVTFLASTRPNF
jgi:hypothetical protein